jgi:hypothetical protein
MVAREMLERRHQYKRGLEHWTFVVTDKEERLMAIVPFARAKPKLPQK